MIVNVYQAMRQREDEDEDELEEQFYLRRLEAGLFSLQLIDYVMLEICNSGAPSVSLTGQVKVIV